MAEQTVKRRRTMIRIAVQHTEYAPGKGSTTTWKPLTVRIGTNEKGEPILTDCFYCEWMSSYGSVAIAQQADGVLHAARVRIPFVQKVYDALTQRDVRIYKNGAMDDAHCFVLASGANNYIEGNKLLEFQVKKQEVR